MVDATVASWLSIPAAHGGHREFDLAMMRLFGGRADASPRTTSVAPARVRLGRSAYALHQIAPLVVHAIKFGGGYVPAARAAIERYG